MSRLSRRRFVGTAAAAAAWTTPGRVPGAEAAIPAAGRGGTLKLGLAAIRNPQCAVRPV